MWIQHAINLTLKSSSPVKQRLSIRTNDITSLDNATLNRLYQVWTLLDNLSKIVPPCRNISLAFDDKNHLSVQRGIEDVFKLDLSPGSLSCDRCLIMSLFGLLDCNR